MSVFYSSQQSEIWIQPNSSGSFVKIAQATNINPPGVTRKFEDVGTLDSTGGFTEYSQTGNDTDTCTFDLLWYPADPGQAAFEVQANLAAGQVDAYEIRLPQVSVTAKFSFSGIAMKSKPTLAKDTSIRSSCEIRTTGVPTYTP